MPDIIRDGSGRGYTAGVDEGNRLLVSAFTQTEFGYHAQKFATAYGVYCRATAVTAGNNEGLLYFKNNETEDLIVTKFTFSVANISHASTPNYNDNVSAKFELFFNITNPVMTNSGAFSNRIPLNMNRGSTAQANVLCYDGGNNSATGGSGATTTWLGVTGSSTENEFLDVRLNTLGTSQFEWSTQEGLILAPGTALYLQYEASLVGARVRSNMFFYKETHV